MRTALDLERKVLACRDALKFLAGERWAERIAPWKAHLRARPDRTQRLISYVIAEAAGRDDVTAMWLIAAYAEVIEAGEDA